VILRKDSENFEDRKDTFATQSLGIEDEIMINENAKSDE
jgi:hypothetical protein